MSQPKTPEEIVKALSSIGMDPESIATHVRKPVAEIRATLVTSKLPEVDEELRDEARAFARAALRRARIFMDFGLPSQQISLIRTVLPVAIRSLGAAEDGGSDDTKQQLQVLFSEIRNVPNATKTIGEPIDVESSPTTKATDDKDQIFGDSSV